MIIDRLMDVWQGNSNIIEIQYKNSRDFTMMSMDNVVTVLKQSNMHFYQKHGKR